MHQKSICTYSRRRIEDIKFLSQGLKCSFDHGKMLYKTLLYDAEIKVRIKRAEEIKRGIEKEFENCY